MIEYIAVYNGADKPRAVKRIVFDSGEIIDTPIAFEFADEVENFSDEEIYEHLKNIVQYIRDTAGKLSPIGLNELTPNDGWHFKGGWGEIEWAKEEALKWWTYIYYRDEKRYISSEEEQAILSEQGQNGI
jgi:hypothetical protein